MSRAEYSISRRRLLATVPAAILAVKTVSQTQAQERSISQQPTTPKDTQNALSTVVSSIQYTHVPDSVDKLYSSIKVPKQAAEKNQPITFIDAQPLFDATNAYRKSQKLPPLQFDPRLAEIAIERVGQMITTDNLDHYDRNGKDLLTPLIKAYNMEEPGIIYGENIGRTENKPDLTGFSPFERLCEKLIQSPRHKANIDEAQWAGMAAGLDTNNKWFWIAQIFSFPR